MTEQQIQKKILDWLAAEKHYARKIVTANKAGTPDILGVTSWGQGFGIEVKAAKGVVSELQEYNLQLIRQANGIALVAYSVADVVTAFSQAQPK